MKGLGLAQEVLERERWTPTPLLRAHVIGERLGAELWLKREDCTPAGSFKLRGALVAMARLADGLPDAGVYVASSGNFGLAIAMAGQRYGVPVSVVVPEAAMPAKMARIRLHGATVIAHGGDFDVAKDFARSAAANAGAAFWEDGAIKETELGSATIAAELLTHPDPWDYVVVPLGNGALLKGIATVFKARSPQTRVAGLVPSGSPAMAHVLRGQPWDQAATLNTTADGLAVRVPIRGMVEDLKALVDDVWLVDESKLLPAVRSFMELEQVMAEPSAAITLAGLVEHREEVQGKRIALILSGAHLNISLMPVLSRAEGLV